MNATGPRSAPARIRDAPAGLAHFLPPHSAREPGVCVCVCVCVRVCTFPRTRRGARVARGARETRDARAERAYRSMTKLFPLKNLPLWYWPFQRTLSVSM